MTSALSRMLAREQVRYVLVGGFNTVFGYGVFVALELGLREWPYLVVLLVAHVIGVLEAFVLHRVVTFRAKGHVWLDLVRFWSVYLGALAVNVVLLPLLVEVFGVPVLIAQPFVLLAVALGTYTGHKAFSFRRTAQEPVVLEPTSPGSEP